MKKSKFTGVNRAARRLGKRSPKGTPFRRVIAAASKVAANRVKIGNKLEGHVLVPVYRDSDYIMVGYHATKGTRVWTRRFVMNEYKRAGIAV